MDASSITAIRTAACSGVATRALARDDAGDLAILGVGVQARTHLAAMRAVRTLRRVRVWSRTAASAQRFAAESPVPVEVMPTARAAVDGADLICTTTAAREPILDGASGQPGSTASATRCRLISVSRTRARSGTRPPLARSKCSSSP